MASKILQDFPRYQYPAFYFESARTVVLCADPVNCCPSCCKPHTIFVSREGRTLCWRCDENRGKVCPNTARQEGGQRWKAQCKPKP